MFIKSQYKVYSVYSCSGEVSLRIDSSSESQDEMESGLLLNVVVGKGSAVFKLLTCEDKSLLIGWDALLVLDLCLYVLNGVCWLDVESNGLAGEGLDEDLHATTESEDQVKGGLFLDVVVTEGSAILELLSSEDESLLVGWNTFLVLDLGLDVLDSVCWLDVEGDGLTSEGLHKDLHATSESENKMECGLLLDVVVGEGSAVFELLTSEDESLLVGRNTFLILDLGLDIFNGVCWLNIECDCLSCKCLDENLHVCLV